MVIINHILLSRVILAGIILGIFSGLAFLRGIFSLELKMQEVSQIGEIFIGQAVCLQEQT